MADDNVQRIVIVGGGAFGGLWANHLLEAIIQHAHERYSDGVGPVEIILCDKNELPVDGTGSPTINGGLAYGKQASAGRKTNISLERMNVSFAGVALRDNFIDRDTGRSRANRILHSAVVRHEVTDFLQERLQYLQSISSSNIKFRAIKGEAIKARNKKDCDNCHEITIKTGDGDEDFIKIEAHHIILAMGHTGHNREVAVIKQFFIDNPALEHDYFPSATYDASNIDIPEKNNTVLILGNGLSAEDTEDEWRQRGYKGAIIRLSNSSQQHFQYPKGRGVRTDIDLPAPRFLQRNPSRFAEGSRRRAHEERAMVREAIQEFKQLTGYRFNHKRGCFTEGAKSQFLKAALSRTLYPEEVLSQWEHHTPQIMERVGYERFFQLYKRFNSVITSMRVGAANDIIARNRKSRSRFKTDFVAGRITEIRRDWTRDRDGFPYIVPGYLVYYTPTDKPKETHVLRVHKIVSSIGPDFSLVTDASPLLSDMLEMNAVRPHNSGFGLDVDFEGRARCDGLHGGATIWTCGTLRAGAVIMGQTNEYRSFVGPAAINFPRNNALIRRSVATLVYDLSAKASHARRKADYDRLHWYEKKIDF
ncbi:MAG: hypothetical protein GC136_01900 [Alphaproteobacteria bacterium]|nr:hypothetical protein [Alphaproteobacteria bacterium]